MVLWLSASVLGETPSDRRPAGAGLQKIQAYAFAEDIQESDGDPGKQAYDPPPSPGVTVGYTYHDLQHYGSVGRMIDWGWDATNGLLVHFSWTYMPVPVLASSVYAYNLYSSSVGAFLGPFIVQPHGEYAGFVGIDVTTDNRAVVGGHNDLGGLGAQPHIYWDFATGAGFFAINSRVPDSVAEYGGEPGQEVKWPKVRYQEAGGDPVLHVIARVAHDSVDGPGALYYFRKQGTNDAGTWNYPPYVVDTVFNYAYDLDASNITGKVAIVWVANLPMEGDCDTCSNNDGANHPTMDNDLYYQVSPDQGWSWYNRVNITKNEDGTCESRPGNEVSALIDSDEKLHIVWIGRTWPADANDGGEIGDNCSIFHWSEDIPELRVVHHANWHQTTCKGPEDAMNLAGVSISECDSKLYVVFVQFNDIPNGVEDDCSHAGLQGEFDGTANGELFMCVSNTGGLNWDRARNLTNTYTPDCGPGEPAGPCGCEYWPSVAPFGTDYTGDFSSAAVVDPSGSYSGDYFLDVQYVYDPEPGAGVLGDDPWEAAEIRWFRLACVEPIQEYPPDFALWAMSGSLTAWGYNQYLSIDSAGNVLVYESEVQVGLLDSVVASLSLGHLEEIYDSLVTAGFFALASEYDEPVRDGSALSITVQAYGTEYNVFSGNFDCDRLDRIVRFLNNLIGPYGIELSYGTLGDQSKKAEGR
jgi:hypothetical protein